MQNLHKYEAIRSESITTRLEVLIILLMVSVYLPQDWESNSPPDFGCSIFVFFSMMLKDALVRAISDTKIHYSVVDAICSDGKHAVAAIVEIK